jgi:hypothetical protein
LASEVFVRVKHRAGNEFLRPINKLRDPGNMSEKIWRTVWMKP